MAPNPLDQPVDQYRSRRSRRVLLTWTDLYGPEGLHMSQNDFKISETINHRKGAEEARGGGCGVGEGGGGGGEGGCGPVTRNHHINALGIDIAKHVCPPVEMYERGRSACASAWLGQGADAQLHLPKKNRAQRHQHWPVLTERGGEGVGGGVSGGGASWYLLSSPGTNWIYRPPVPPMKPDRGACPPSSGDALGRSKPLAQFPCEYYQNRNFHSNRTTQLPRTVDVWVSSIHCRVAWPGSGGGGEGG